MVEPMFCFETAFKLLNVSWAAYFDDNAGSERQCTLQEMLQGAPGFHALPPSVPPGGQCMCDFGQHVCQEVWVCARLPQRSGAHKQSTESSSYTFVLLWHRNNK